MRICLTGANGFVGRRLTARLSALGHDVAALAGPDIDPAPSERVEMVCTDLSCPIPDAVATLIEGAQAVIHLAAISSSRIAKKKPIQTWDVNVLGALRIAEAVSSDALFLFPSTCDVYGDGEPPYTETARPVPRSTYAASKLAAEIALKQAADRRGFRLIVARAFPHSGRGQNPVFVLPSLADKILLAKSVGASAVTVGNIDVIREMMHVDDVVDAYVRLLDCGEVGTYNVAAGQGYRLSELFTRLANIADATVIPEADTSLIRTTDIPVLVGDGTKIREVTGWTPVKNVEDVLLDVLEDARARISA